MRLFVAIQLAPLLQKKIFNTTRHLRPAAPGKWVEQNNLHITLAFIGEVGEDAVTAILTALTGAVKALPPVDFVIEGLIGIPDKSPHVLAFNINTPSTYSSLQRAVINSLKQLKIHTQARPLHLTLVRLKKPILNWPALKPLGLKLQIREISLMQSILTLKGPIYKRLGSLNLASGEPVGQLRPNIAICVLNPKNEVLLIRSSQHNRRDWQFPQGGVEPSELPENAAKREIKEEVGLDNIKILKILEKIYKYHWPKRLIKLNQGHAKEGFVGQEQSLAIATIKEIRPRLKTNPREASNYKWVSYDLLLKSISPVRRGLASIAMVELKRMISNTK